MHHSKVTDTCGVNEAQGYILPQSHYAHLTPEGRPHFLEDHLRETARLTKSFGWKLQAAEMAERAGAWHDLGKYSDAFQHRIITANGFESHLEGDHSARPDHSTAGALWAKNKLEGVGLPIILAIAGHHGGLKDPKSVGKRLRDNPQRLDEALVGEPPAEFLDLSHVPLPDFLYKADGKSLDPHRFEMFTRMLYSALCDADFLDTEAFYDSARSSERLCALTLRDQRARLDTYLDGLQAKAPSTEVNRTRKEILDACLAAVEIEPGFFSLTVPTGGGKTLSSLAFALGHAERHDLDRVIVAIPYTSITEQTSDVFRQALGSEAILEHHSLLEPSKETVWNRVASENWDAPLVVTTTVQLFESLFANRSSACRKLHRIARSVIILDEAQTLPPHLLSPILDGLKTLVRDYGCTVLICTATQPAFRKSPAMPEGIETIREIIPSELRLFERLRRVRIQWPATSDPLPYDTLADDLVDEDDVLAIVHKRKDARELCLALDSRLGHSDTLHLSALMCAAHRSQVLADIQRRKRSGQPVRLIATQLVEAGVDLDFRVVYRAMGGIDSLAQAAGRCNREGKLPGLGELRVFHAPTVPPAGVPRKALDIARGLIDSETDLFDPELYRRYFTRLYDLSDRDSKEIQEYRKNLDFEAVARHFKLIEDDWSASIVVPFGEAQTLIEELRQKGPSRQRMRALQRYTVTVPRKLPDEWIRRGYAELVADSVPYLFPSAAYDWRFGLDCERVGPLDPSLLIID